MKTPLTVGQRVKLRGYAYGGINIDGQRAVINKIELLGGDIHVKLIDVAGSCYVKPSQIIPLKKKKRFECWVNVYKEDVYFYGHNSRESADSIANNTKGSRIACYRMVKAKDQS